MKTTQYRATHISAEHNCTRCGMLTLKLPCRSEWLHRRRRSQSGRLRTAGRGWRHGVDLSQHMRCMSGAMALAAQRGRQPRQVRTSCATPSASAAPSRSARPRTPWTPVETNDDRGSPLPAACTCHCPSAGASAMAQGSHGETGGGVGSRGRLVATCSTSITCCRRRCAKSKLFCL